MATELQINIGANTQSGEISVGAGANEIVYITNRSIVNLAERYGQAAPGLYELTILPRNGSSVDWHVVSTDFAFVTLGDGRRAIQFRLYNTGAAPGSYWVFAKHFMSVSK